jgi:hypothetical protein
MFRSRHRSRAWRVATTATVVVMALVWSTASVSADTSSTTTTTLPPAPPGFTDTVVGVYQSVVATAQSLGQGQNLEPVAQYQQQVDSLDPATLAAFYDATQQVPQWTQIPSVMETVAAEVPPGASGPPPAATSAFRARSAPTAARTHVVLTAANTPLDPPAAVLTGQTVTTPGPFTPTSCGVYPPDAAVFALQLAVDISSALFNVLVVLGTTDTFVSNFGAETAAFVVAGVTAVLQVVHDTLAYLQQIWNECAAANVAGEVGNIDNTTVFTYGLITQLGTAVANLQSTENTTQQDVANSQTGLSSLATSVEQALSSDTQALQVTGGTDTQSTATELQTIQTALQSDLTTIENVQTTTGQTEKAEVDKGTTTLQTALSAALTQILHETDADAQGVTVLVTQGNQQIMNALQSTFSAQQQQFDTSLQLEIEEGLAGWQPVVPEVQLMQPASMGGYLNSTPVGVQEVVTSDLQALQAIGVAVKPAAITYLNAANAALAAGQWATAWNDYALSYHSFA